MSYEIFFYFGRSNKTLSVLLKFMIKLNNLSEFQVIKILSK